MPDSLLFLFFYSCSFIPVRIPLFRFYHIYSDSDLSENSFLVLRKFPDQIFLLSVAQKYRNHSNRRRCLHRLSVLPEHKTSVDFLKVIHAFPRFSHFFSVFQASNRNHKYAVRSLVSDLRARKNHQKRRLTHFFRIDLLSQLQKVVLVNKSGCTCPRAVSAQA